MKINIDHEKLGTQFYGRIPCSCDYVYNSNPKSFPYGPAGINFPTTFYLTDYFTDDEVGIIRNDLPKLTFWNKSWLLSNAHEINIFDKCSKCGSKDLRFLYLDVLEELSKNVLGSAGVVNFQCIKYCHDCNFCKNDVLEINFDRTGYA